MTKRMDKPIKTNQELLEENFSLKQRIRELEQSAINSEQTKEALWQSNETFRILIENSHDIIYTLSPEGVFTFVSPSWTEMLGYPITQVIGRSFRPVIHPDDVGQCEEVVRSVLETGQRQGGVEYRVRHMDGSWRWHATNGVPVKDETGRIIAFEGIARDITQQKWAETELRNSEERFRSLVETISDWIWEVDAQGVYTYASPKVKDILGYEPSEILGKTPMDLMPPDEAKRAAKIIGEYFEHKKHITRFENLNLHKDGWIVVLETSGVPIIDENGYLKGYRGIDRDITDRKFAEEELVWKTALLEAQVEATLDGILVVDKKGQRILSNQHLLDIWQVPQHIRDDKDDTALYKYVMSIAKAPKKFIEKVMYLDDHPDEMSRDEVEFKNGKILDLYSSPVFGKDGKYYGRIWTYRDITDRKQAEHERLHREKLQSILEMAGAVCHEMNQPMQIISGYATLLSRNASENDPIKGKLDTINEQIARMAIITKKLMTINDYQTQDYAGLSRIINISESSDKKDT